MGLEAEPKQNIFVLLADPVVFIEPESEQQSGTVTQLSTLAVRHLEVLDTFLG